MLKLGPAQDRWIGDIPSGDKKDQRPFLLPGVRVLCAPIDKAAARAARRAVAEALKVDKEAVEEAGDAMSCEFLRRGIRQWEGIGDLDGNPAEPTPEMIELALANLDFFEAADIAYVRPWVLRDLEGKGSPVSRPGTGAPATGAGDTARSRASKSRARAAKAAPTKSTGRKPARAKASGRS